MSEENRGENEVFSILRECAMLGLREYGLDSGIEVQKFAQANMTYQDKLVLMQLTHHRKVGWQAHYYKQDAIHGFKRSEEWIDEQYWSISTIKRMQNTDSADTVTADDIALALVTWFNGPGLDWLRNNGMATLPIDPTEIMVYTDDSQLYQRRPVFEMVVQVPKAYAKKSNEVTALEVETHPV